MTALHPGRLVEYTFFGVFVGMGGQTLGILQSEARLGHVTGRFRAIGGIDSDPRACAAYRTLTGSPATCLDLFTAGQYTDFHGRPPPEDWREATPADILAASGGELPDVAGFTPPCKGFSGLNAHRSATLKYVALNRLAVHSLELCLAAWADRPPRLILLENVPGIASRGRPLLDAIEVLLKRYGYAVAGYTHDCGELGGLAQHRERFLLVARHRESVPPFLYEPPKKRVRAVGEVLSALPLPEAEGAGPLHRVPRLEWRTWLRLALIEAGKDWRSLSSLPVEDGFVRGMGIVPEARNFGGGPLGVIPWDEPAGTIAAESRPTNGLYSVADPRAPRDIGEYQPYGVQSWEDPAHTVTSKAAPGSGPYSVADPRCSTRWGGKGKYRIAGMDEPAGAVIAESHSGNGAYSIADPRLAEGRFNNVFRLVQWDAASPAVTGGGTPSAGGLAVADPRIDLDNDTGFRRGYYGVVPWSDPSGCVTGSACHDNGAWSVSDPRPLPIDPKATPDPFPLIVALDGTWHRPFTTLELAALQGFLEVVPAEAFQRALVAAAGTPRGRQTFDSLYRLWIGNALPPPAKTATGSTMIYTLLLADAGQTFVLSSAPIWVDRRLAMLLSVDTGGAA